MPPYYCSSPNFQDLGRLLGIASLTVDKQILENKHQEISRQTGAPKEDVEEEKIAVALS